MSAFDYFAASVEGFAPSFPTAGEASVPHDWNSSLGAGFMPFPLSRARWAEWLKRFARLSVSLNVNDPEDYNLTFNFDMGRKMLSGAGVTESEIRLPGIAASFGHASTDGPFLYQGNASITGFDDNPENNAAASLTLYLGAKRTVGNNLETAIAVPHLTVDSLGQWYPSFILDASISYEAGAEFAYSLRSYVDPDEVDPPLLTTTGSFAPSHGGGDFPLRVFGTTEFDPSGASCIIIPNLWLGWGAWNPSNGLPL